MLLITKYHLILAQGSQLLPALMAATLVHGMGGGRHVVVMSIFALVADVTTKKERTTYIARFESIILSAFTVGPLLGGIMVKAFDSNIPPLYLSIILDAFTIGWFIFVVPETMRNKEEGTEDYERLPDSEVAEDNVAAIVAQGSVIPEEAWNAETHKDEAAQPKPKRSRLASLHRSIFHSHNRNRSLLVLILLVLNLVSNGLMFFFVLYTRAHFGWKAFEDGIYSFLTSSSRIVSLSLVLPYVLMRLQGAGVSGHEVWIVRFGLAMYVLALYLYGTVETGWGFLLGKWAWNLWASAGNLTRFAPF